MNKLIYKFKSGNAEGSAAIKKTLGNKGAALADMCNIGLPIPAGFTIPTDYCHEYLKTGELNKNIITALTEGITFLEQESGKGFGDENNPLLVSVRSGAAVSLPGMMDTILNLGLNDRTVEALAAKTGDRRFALDCYRRFIQMYADVVLGIEHFQFEIKLHNAKIAAKVTNDSDLNINVLEDLIEEYKILIHSLTNKPFPQDVGEQLQSAVASVFASWHNQRAIKYRKINNIDDSLGTAVNIQTMVFGNMGQDSATGVLFTRNPSTGEDEIYGEYLINAQGEDVVAGIRTPDPISGKNNKSSLEYLMPHIYKQLLGFAKQLENHYKDMQDIEFTIENDKLWLLQTRSGKRNAAAMVKIAHSLYHEEILNQEEALLRLDPDSLTTLMHKQIDPSAKYKVIAQGLPASSGAAVGRLVFTSEAAENSAANDALILVREETSPEDIGGMDRASGIITMRGGMTSHAAVVARGMGKPCITSVSGVRIDLEQKKLHLADGMILGEVDIITINGATGEVILGESKTKPATISKEFSELLSWSDQLSNIKVKANAETPKDIKTALNFGAIGVGLCRTEHMFFSPERIESFRHAILAKTESELAKSLRQLEKFQYQDFTEIFQLLNGKAIAIRLLDPPLHEFLPHKDSDIEKLSDIIGINKLDLKQRIKNLQENNPMLGHRGARLGITHPQIYAMQIRAIFKAALSDDMKSHKAPQLEIMLPLIFCEQELLNLRDLITDIYQQISSEYQKEITYKIGAMIELPKAALIADKLAKHLDFISFGTNDLTQTALGISRDDASSFINSYLKKGIIAHDPFTTIDEDGVGQLVSIAVTKARSINPNIDFCVCGEHGGDTKSIEFLDKLLINNTSCSPYRIPMARIAAARSAIMRKDSDSEDLSLIA